MASVQVSYPGVYIQELSSGQHTITGVATSIAVFIGWAHQGPVDRPVLVENFPEYNTIFGGLSPDSLLGYSVNQFFANGGSRAYILRLVAGADVPAATTKAVTADAVLSGMTIFANSPGAWANTIRLQVTAPVSATIGFTINVFQTSSGAPVLLESFANLTVVPASSRYVVAVINADSNYITFIDPANPAAVIPTPAVPAAATVLLNAGTPGLDGDILDPTNVNFPGEFGLALLGTVSNNGYKLLDRLDIFNILCVPGYSNSAGMGFLQAYCQTRRAFLIIDAPPSVTHAQLKTAGGPVDAALVSFLAANSNSAAYYFPWIIAPDPLFGGRPKPCPPCGFVAGVYAATDANRGVWKAPAGIDAGLVGLLGLSHVLSDQQNGDLNPIAVNCLRRFTTFGNVVWGARTLEGSDMAGSQWKYVPIRRLALYIESSLYYGTQWAVFEPNDETLWGQLRMNVGTFMQGLFLQGAFAGHSAQQAYFVKCDAENNPPSSTALGVVNIAVGFAPLYPAEFVVIQIRQIFNQS